MNAQPKKLLDQIRDLIRVKHYSIRTEEAYVSWARRYILFHDKRHPREMGSAEMWFVHSDHVIYARKPMGKSRQRGG